MLADCTGGGAVPSERAQAAGERNRLFRGQLKQLVYFATAD